MPSIIFALILGFSSFFGEFRDMHPLIRPMSSTFFSRGRETHSHGLVVEDESIKPLLSCWMGDRPKMYFYFQRGAAHPDLAKHAYLSSNCYSSWTKSYIAQVG